MLLLHRLALLPPCLLVVIADAPPRASGQALQWPYNLPEGAKYYPEDEVHIQRDLAMRQRLSYQSPVGIKKMSTDPGEKFYLEQWSFRDDDHNMNIALWTNETYHTYDPPAPPHCDEKDSWSPLHPRYLRIPLVERTVFDKRAYQCPTGYTACTSIDRPNSCCATGATCQIIQNTGLGDVGCCAAGETCAGQLTSCETGYTSCPSSLGGGCCLPGYACQDVGCVLTSTAVVFATSTPTELPTSYFTTTVTSTVIVPISPSPSTSTRTIVVNPTSSAPATFTSPASTEDLTTTVYTTVTASSTSTQPIILTCSTGFRSCPASLGGGCCPTNRACAAHSCPALSSTNSLSGPVRPTTATTVTSSLQSSFSGTLCPTGFYACSAYYRGGCCQTDRHCDTTSCPAVASISLITTNGITIVAPTGTGITTNDGILTGPCAGGWFSCAATNGGGCCPSGYACGVSCTATATDGQTNLVGKIAPNGGGRVVADASLAIWCLTFSLSALVAFY